MKLRALLILVAVALAPVPAITAQAHDGGAETKAKVRWLVSQGGHAPGDAVPGAAATLVRTADAVSMKLNTTGLRPGHAYTVWWAIFNEPRRCTGAVKPPGAARCGDPDWVYPLAEPATVWAAGGVVGKDGAAGFKSRLAVGDTTYDIMPWELGLTNPTGAEIQLFVRDHGPAVKGSDQTATFNGGCANYVPGLGGTPGTYPCENVQFAGFAGR